MKLENAEIIKEFYEEKVQDKYPDLSLMQVRDVCRFPFLFTRKNIESGNLLPVRLQYFGLFVSYPGRILYNYKTNKEKFERNLINFEKYEYLQSMIGEHIRKYPERFKKHNIPLEIWIWEN